ncbi:MAG: nucleotidyltransferase domain-containing protein [Prevotella sp.]|nr:nucleotidyltransferase domain-containing protein [Prevotella sp.]
MSKDGVLTAIKDVANNGIPKDASVILYGSQARGDAGQGSDWDLLILLDKKHLRPGDHDLYSYPFWKLGWKIDTMIHPALYTKSEWDYTSPPTRK